jgi:hypothetical protein
MIIPDKKVSKNPFIGFSIKKKKKILRKFIEKHDLKGIKLLIQSGIDLYNLNRSNFAINCIIKV